MSETKFKISDWSSIYRLLEKICWNKWFIFWNWYEFGKSAPYKEIYKYFGLTAENISKKIKNLIKTNIWTIKVGINGMGRIGRMVIRAIIESQK